MGKKNKTDAKQPAPPEQPAPPQDAERDALAAVFERHGLPALQSLEPVGNGDGLTEFIVNGELRVQINRDDAEHRAFSKKVMILRRLRQSADVPAPDVLVLDVARDVVPYDVLVLAPQHGVVADTVWPRLSQDEREALSEEAGRICGTIHNLKWAAYGDYNASTQTLGQYPRWADLLLLRLERAASRARDSRALPHAFIDAIITEINDGDSILEAASAPVLVHGNLHLGNLLLQERLDGWHVSGITGWDMAFSADAAWEFGVFSFREPEHAPLGDSFLYGYRERHALQPDLRSRMHLYRLLYHLESAIAARTQAPINLDRRQNHEQHLRRLLQR
jgi:aminoglycoside phosphotransferase (APT) family kinase protein